MNIHDILLLEPFHVPANMKNYDAKHLINKNASFPVDYMTYLAGIMYIKAGILATKFHSVPLGLAQISAILKERGINTSHEPFILDALKRPLSDSEIENRIRSHDYDQVWMSVGSQDEAKEAIRYAGIVKSIDAETLVMLGGIFPTFYPEWFLRQPAIDLIIRGPAEDAVRQYVMNGDAARACVPGLCHKHKNEIFIAPIPETPPDQAKLPAMDLEGMNIEAYMKDNPFANLLTSRGCPFSCPFCSHTAYWGKAVQYRNMENVRKELRMFQDHGCKTGYIVDSAFTLNEKHVQRFVDVFKQEKITIKFAFETRADHFNNSMAKLCASFKPALVWFGGESGALEILSRLPGKQGGGGRDHLRDMKAAVKNANDANIISGSSWIIGLPGETNKTIEETKRFILELFKAGMDIADVRNLQIFPGTDYYDNAVKWGLFIDGGTIRLEKGPWQETVSHHTSDMSGNQIKAATKAIQSEILEFYKSKPDHRRILRAITAVQFMARHPSIARTLIRAANKI
ncbi:MAG TPA: radical SAM protein [Candidatus Lokiarchaeia archaeon]|nr:radical SAM protein [Candidatus Lokiarchaeia archaeon]